MALYASLGHERVRATLAGPRRAVCSDCATPMIAKTGDVVIHHWAHETRPVGCSIAGETEWHREWKTLGFDGSQEVAVGNRRADVLSPGGFAIEFQLSSLTYGEVRSREADWCGKLVWVFDAREAYAENRLRTLGDGPRLGYHWYRAPERIHGATCPTFYDIGNKRLLFVLSARHKGTSSLSGQCSIHTRDDIVRWVLRGVDLPSLPVQRFGDSERRPEPGYPSPAEPLSFAAQELIKMWTQT